MTAKSDGPAKSDRAAKPDRTDGAGRGAARPSARPSARPFARPVDVRRLPEGGQHCEIGADEAECQALAAAMGLPSVAALRGSFDLRPRAGGRVILTGLVEAEVMQSCVVTLEPFPTRIRQDIDLVFAPAQPEELVERRRGGGRDDFDGEAMPRPVPGSDDQADPPDPIINGTIDLGAVAAEFVALALDPYPRAPGARFDDVVEADEDVPSAFAALERLKAKS